MKGTQSFEALTLLERSAPKASGDVEQIVLAVDHGRVTDPAVRARAQAMLARVAALPRCRVGRVAVCRRRERADLAVGAGRVRERDAHRAGDQVHRQPGAAVRQHRQGGCRRRPAGAGRGTGRGSWRTRPSINSVGLGALAALIVLLLVFGSLLAAALPLITAGVALGAGTATIGLLSHLIDMASFSSQLSLLIGLGVGVDYALFIVTRYRQGLQRGKSVEESIIDAVDTSGRAVMFAGMTVCIALLGMFALGVSFLYGVAIAASVVVAVHGLDRVDAAAGAARVLRHPGAWAPCPSRARGRRADRRSTAAGWWQRWTGVLQARPALIATAAALVMVVIAIPFLSMRLGSSDAGSDPAGSTTRQAYDLLAKGFGPGYNGPLQLVAQVDSAGQRPRSPR